MSVLPRSPANDAAASRSFGSLATPMRIRALRHGLILCGVLAAVLIAWRAYETGTPTDAFVYWSFRPPVVYESGPGTHAFLYSPVVAQVSAPVTTLPWQVFLALWLAAMVVALAWITGPLLLLPAVILASSEIHHGNAHFFVAAAMVLGFRYPAAWAVPLLTKVTPGIGLLWFAVRREWRALAVALSVTAAIVVVSFVIDPAGWIGWVRMLFAAATTPGAAHPTVVPGPVWLRLLLAAAVVIAGARLNQRWTIPVAAVICLPHSTLGLNLLVALIPLSGIRSLRPGWRQALS